jgi:hypothetical protein
VVRTRNVVRKSVQGGYILEGIAQIQQAKDQKEKRKKRRGEGVGRRSWERAEEAEREEKKKRRRSRRDGEEEGTEKKKRDWRNRNRLLLWY